MNLTIDTHELYKITLTLEGDGKRREKVIDATKERSQQLLPALTAFLAEQELRLEDITALSLHTGPGSFTGLRVGAIIATTLSLLLQIPLNGNAPGTLPELQYGENRWNL